MVTGKPETEADVDVDVYRPRWPYTRRAVAMAGPGDGRREKPAIDMHITWTST